MNRLAPRPLSLALGVLTLAGAAAPAVAGGIHMPVTVEARAPDGDGLVALKVTLKRADFDCQPTVWLASAKGGYGPALFLERFDGKAWKRVQVAWRWGVEPERTARDLGKRLAPASQRAFRLDWDCSLVVRRKAALPPGTYRVLVEARAPGFGDWAFECRSKPFHVPASAPRPDGKAKVK
jgi:hypothetical protein